MACRESSITAACYLCNTLSKTAGVAPFRAVPLLRVQGPSVIVMLRRRRNFTGAAVLAATAPKPVATYEFKDQDTVALNVRVQRNF